jgi:phosphoribosylaminoimidazolecarboxamide formyltransferase/IMP cyclohydrolase
MNGIQRKYCWWSNTTLRRKPTSKGFFFGDFDAIFNKVHGKDHTTILDVDAAVNLINEFKNDGPTFAIKNNNACGL